MRILAFAASNSRHSINKQLVTAAAEILRSELLPEADIEILDLNDFEMPLFSIDRQNDSGIPEIAQSFFEKIGASDALLISYAEHNGTYTAAFKNVFDWASRIDPKVFQSKPTVTLATSPGPRGGANVLAAAEKSAPFYGADLRASFSLPKFYDSFDKDTSRLISEDKQLELRGALSSLVS